MLRPHQIKERRQKIAEQERYRKECEADEIINRLRNPYPKLVILDNKEFTMEFWIEWSPKNEKQAFSEKEEISSGGRGNYESSSCPICEADINKR